MRSVANFAVDTSCIVAAVCSWHEHHEAAAAEIERRLDRRGRLCVPAPALIEAYAVLTRLPPPHRLSAADAWVLIETTRVLSARGANTGEGDLVAIALRLKIVGDLIAEIPSGWSTFEQAMSEAIQSVR